MGHGDMNHALRREKDESECIYPLEMCLSHSSILNLECVKQNNMKVDFIIDKSI